MQHCQVTKRINTKNPISKAQISSLIVNARRPLHIAKTSRSLFDTESSSITLKAVGRIKQFHFVCLRLQQFFPFRSQKYRARSNFWFLKVTFLTAAPRFNSKHLKFKRFAKKLWSSRNFEILQSILKQLGKFGSAHFIPRLWRFFSCRFFKMMDARITPLSFCRSQFRQSEISNFNLRLLPTQF